MIALPEESHKAVEGDGPSQGSKAPKIFVRTSCSEVAKRSDLVLRLDMLACHVVLPVRGEGELADLPSLAAPRWWMPADAAACRMILAKADRLGDGEGMRIIAPAAWIPDRAPIVSWIEVPSRDEDRKETRKRRTGVRRRAPRAVWIESDSPAALFDDTPRAGDGPPPTLSLRCKDPLPTLAATIVAMAALSTSQQVFGICLPFEPFRSAAAADCLLDALDLRPRGVKVVACPTCGRCRIDVESMARQVEEALASVTRPLTVAVMGCAVNGPGEARHAHCGIAGGKGDGLLFRSGKILGKRAAADLVKALVAEVLALADDPATRNRPTRDWPPYAPVKRPAVRPIRVGKVLLGGGSPPSVQSMTNTSTADREATIRQIMRLADVGCQIARVAVPDDDAVAALPTILAASPLPIVADVHFSARLAMAALEAGVDKLRINPGNIGGPQRVQPLLDRAAALGIPIRVGANAGSLKREHLSHFGGPTAEALAMSAMEPLALCEAAGFRDLVVSLKSSSVPDTVLACRLLAEQVPYPFHLGITEAGLGLFARIRSAAGIGLSLLDGIGETIRVSLTGDPVDEVPTAFEILEAARTLRPKWRSRIDLAGPKEGAALAPNSSLS